MAADERRYVESLERTVDELEERNETLHEEMTEVARQRNAAQEEAEKLDAENRELKKMVVRYRSQILDAFPVVTSAANANTNGPS